MRYNHSIPSSNLFLVLLDVITDFNGNIVETSFFISIGQKLGATGIFGKISFVFPFRDSGAQSDDSDCENAAKASRV